MLKRTLFAALIAAPMLWVAPAAAQTATDYAAGMQAKVGQPLGGAGLTITSAKAEGNTLVLAIDGPAGWRGTATAEQVSTEMVKAMCGSGNNFFKNGVTMRIDSYDNKAAYLKGPLVKTC